MPASELLATQSEADTSSHIGVAIVDQHQRYIYATYD
jgi:hypothetical protein